MLRLALEASVVGIVLAILLAGLRIAAGPGPFASPAAIAATGFGIGAAFHLAFEALGLNAAYCRTGNACRS